MVPPDSDAADEAQTHLPSPLKYILPLDDVFLATVAKQVRQSPHAGKRLGHGWRPSRAAAIEPQADDDVWITREELQPLDDVCTKFCTTHFFPDAFARVNMVANVLRLYERLAKVARLPCKIIFKGGVMLRLVLLEFWRAQPLDARERVVRYLKDQGAITMGDFDFEVVPDDAMHLGDDLKHRLVLVHYAVLLWLRRRLEAEVRQVRDRRPGEPTPPVQLVDATWDRAQALRDLRTSLQAAVDALPSGHALAGATVDQVFLGGDVARPPAGHVTKRGHRVPAPRRNLLVFACDEHKTCVAEAREVLGELGIPAAPARTRGDLLYATCNTYVNEPFPERTRSLERNALFHLSRIKHTFTLYYTTRDGTKRCDRLAGEMVDLSMGDPGDEVNAWKHATFERDMYRAYPLLGVPRDLVIFRSYSPLHFYYDHQSMLHMHEVPPWKTPKYSKRIVRYVAFLVVCVMSSDAPVRTAPRLHALHALVAHVADASAVLAGPPLRTPVALVNAFAACERRSLREGVVVGRRCRRGRRATCRRCTGICGSWWTA